MKGMHQLHLLASVRASELPEQLMSPSQKVPVLKNGIRRSRWMQHNGLPFCPLEVNREGTFKIVTHSGRWKSPSSSDRSKFGED